MNEAFLYYIWQFQYFDKNILLTAAGEAIEIFKAGILNHHSGPDFSNASVRIGGIAWAGNVEIHIKSSDWVEHRHHRDSAYENVILHVVWENDKTIFRMDGSALPVLQLRDRIDATLVRSYDKLIHNPFSIPCTKAFPRVDMMLKHAMTDRALMQRLELKATDVIGVLKQNNNDWEETVWQLLAKNFGFKVNSDPFQQLGKSLPYRIVLKHADKPIQVEALIFGHAGFLDHSVGDEYYQLMRREYTALANKYSIAGKKLVKPQWRFLRLRPANFPTVRLAQFSALMQQRKLLVSKILDAENAGVLTTLFSISQSDYWLKHYRFNKKSKSDVPVLGISSVQNILINTIVPMLVAWGKYNDDQMRIDRAVDILHSLPAESNTIIRAWELLGYPSKTAFDSQGQIELYNNFCLKKSCLNCVIGNHIIKKGF